MSDPGTGDQSTEDLSAPPPPAAAEPRHGADVDRADEWRSLRERYLRPREARPASTARGVHHCALLSSDVERTIRFYQDVLGFPLTDLFENRDYRGSTHFFFDIGIGNTIAFFDFPGLDLGPYQEVLGGHHHLAISMTAEQWEAAKARLDEHGVEYDHVSGTSLYFRGPDGERLELIADPLGEMYGEHVL
jgi:catechol 2,3-dioxygenase-like lactoylglutathione lyase family enzyme